ncbi:MAG: peptidoglycan DD-metalloendopeptidase family protein [Bacteroidota bacterium]
MAKSKYRFIPEELSYRKMHEGKGARFWRTAAYVAAIIVVGFLLNFFYSLFFDSPRERQIRRENQELQRQYDILKERKQVVDTVIQEVRRTDENIYRLIFETEPVDKGLDENQTDPYQALKKLTDQEIVGRSAADLDSVFASISASAQTYNVLMIKSESRAEMLSCLPAIQPIDNPDLTRTASGFGERIHPIYKINKFHSGMDFTAPVGTPVRATGDGVVEIAEASKRGSGNRIVIDHGYGYKTIYSYLDEIKVRPGRKVRRGDEIGTVGNTGLSVAPHLHYEVELNGKLVNPVNYYFLELSPAQYDRMIYISKKSGQSFD